MVQRIISIRKENNLNQEQFAKKLGLSRNFINQVETGKKNVSDRTISDICRVFNISEKWLRTGKGEKCSPKENDAWDEVIERYELTNEEQLLIEKFMNLRPDQREAVLEYMKTLAVAFMADSASESKEEISLNTRPREEKPVTEWTEEEINAEAEEYRQSLLEEKRRGESGSASGGPSSGGIA